MTNQPQLRLVVGVEAVLVPSGLMPPAALTRRAAMVVMVWRTTTRLAATSTTAEEVVGLPARPAVLAFQLEEKAVMAVAVMAATRTGTAHPQMPLRVSRTEAEAGVEGPMGTQLAIDREVQVS